MNLWLMNQPDNRGGSLLMVIIAIIFLGVFGTIIISMAGINSQMKATDRNSRYNFYQTEAALDELRAGLEEDVADGFAIAYEKVLMNYSTMNEAMRKQVFRNEFIKELNSSLNVNPVNDAISLAALNLYLKETKKTGPSSDGAEVVGMPSLDWTSSESFVVLKNLKVVNLRQGYTTSITTDIRIDFPTEGSSAKNRLPYMDYALIGDLGITSCFTDNTITGNIYAGSQGITSGFGNLVTVIGDHILSKGDITVKDSGSLNFSGSELEVWADNLVTAQTNQGDESIGTSNINISGACYIRNDLVLGAYNSKVTLRGQYYGYSSGNGSESNSSIVINAPYAMLDLSGLAKLYLAGRAYVSLEDGAGAVNYHKDGIYGAGEGANSNILTGESLTVKGSQNAYLLPSRFIQVGHNPVSWNEYIGSYDTLGSLDGMAVLPLDAIAFDSTSLPEEKRKFGYYLNEVNPFKKAFYKFGANDNVVYYYLNFKSRELATEYFENYISFYPDKVYNGFPIDSIKLNPSPGACITAGNLMVYDTNVSLRHGTNGTFLNSYGVNFSNLTSTLNKYEEGNSDPNRDQVFEHIIDLAGLQADAASYSEGKLMEKEITLGGEDYYICVIDNEGGDCYSFGQSGKKGIIVVTGDIKINNSFDGLILANGRIELNASEVHSDSALVKKILEGDSELSKYFKAFKDDREASFQVSKCLTFENWSKNK